MINLDTEVGIGWTSLVLGSVALFASLHKFVSHPNQLRVMLLSSCLFVTVNNVLLVLMLDRRFLPFKLPVNVLHTSGFVFYNLGLWTARVYVCVRMGKLTPNPSLSAAFNNSAYVAAAYGMLLIAACAADAVSYYKTNSANTPIVSTLSVAVAGLFANLSFDAANLYLHVKSLQIFPSDSIARKKLFIMSFGTIVSTVFSVARSAFQITGDTLARIAMAHLETTLLPSSIILGEYAASMIGARHKAAPRTSGITRSPTKSSTASSSVSRKEETANIRTTAKLS